MWRAQSTMGVSSLALLMILESARASSTCDRTSAEPDIVCSHGVRHTIDRRFHYYANCYIQGAGVRDSESCPPGWAFQDGGLKQCVLETPALDLNGAESLNECGEMCSMEGESVESVCCTETEAHIPDRTSVMINAIVHGAPPPLERGEAEQVAGERAVVVVLDLLVEVGVVVGALAALAPALLRSVCCALVVLAATSRGVGIEEREQVWRPVVLQ